MSVGLFYLYLARPRFIQRTCVLNFNKMIAYIPNMCYSKSSAAARGVHTEQRRLPRNRFTSQNERKMRNAGI